MGQLIKSFTVGRNFLKQTIFESADIAYKAIQSALGGAVNLQDLKQADNGKYNVFRDLISFTGIIKRENNIALVTEVGQHFIVLYDKNKEDAWRWLVTRTLWLYVIPNGTATGANQDAKSQGISYRFFNLMLGLLSNLSSLSGDERFLSYEELCYLLDDDSNWGKDASSLFFIVLQNRSNGVISSPSTRLLLGDLETSYGIGRDNFNTVLNKAFLQTGLFEYKPNGNSSRGAFSIALSSAADPVLYRRIRFVLDNIPSYDLSSDWNTYLQPRHHDLPLEVTSVFVEDDIGSGGQIEDLLLFERLVFDVLIDRKNVVLYGPPGTGKTHCAFSLADAWTNLNGVDSVINVTFHPAFGYEDFVQGFRPLEEKPGQYSLQPGPLMLAAERAIELKRAGRNVLLVIDEVNRGDVARIFGELITYIEPDKRGRKCRLSQSSSTEFFVPENLYFLGTMNSADKSVSLLDVALRRRFAFIEVCSDPTAFESLEKWVSEIEGLKLSSVLFELNKRLLMAGVEPDRSIGHALLGVSCNVTDPVLQLSQRFLYDIIPLIQEYSYLDRPKIRRILGSLVDESGHPAWKTPQEFIEKLAQYISAPLVSSPVTALLPVESNSF